MAKNIIIYSKVPCPYCVHAKEFFTSRQIPFKEVDLTGKFDEISKLKNRTGHMTLPQIFIDDQFIGGYSDLMEKVESGSLKF